MQNARIKNPVWTTPGAFESLTAIAKASENSGVSKVVLELVNLRIGQINGCSVCVDWHSRALTKLGESSSRQCGVAAWREAPYFTEQERAALALAEAATRLADRADAVPDEIWKEAARHFNEAELSGLVMSIALANLWNRLNATTRQPSGDWIAQYT